MFGLTRWNPFDEVFRIQREVDRLFNQTWSDLSSQPATFQQNFHVRSTDDAWKLSVPMPGFDPKNVTLEVAGSTLSIRAEQQEEKDTPYARFEQSITVPQFVDVEKVTANYRHGVLELTLPLKESVKPRRIQIEAAPSDARQLTAA
jgi:HSP20 family protein